MDRAAIILLFSLEALTLAHAFVAPSQRVQYLTSSSLKALPDVTPFLLTDGLAAATRFNMGTSNGEFSSISGPLSTLRTFFIVVTAAVLGITAIAYLTAAFLIPKAAEQLEEDTNRLRPGLWEEYEAKLEDGESMVNRPDLLQELGNVMQPIIVKEYENDAAMKAGDGGMQGDKATMRDGAGTASGRSSSAKDDGSVTDVTIKHSEEE